MLNGCRFFLSRSIVFQALQCFNVDVYIVWTFYCPHSYSPHTDTWRQHKYRWRHQEDGG